MLPQSLGRQNWTAYPARYLLPACLFDASVKCEAFVTGVGGGARIVLAELTGARRGVVLQQDGGDAWRPIGTLFGAMRCESVRDALRAGRYSWVPSLQQDIEAAGQRLTIAPLPSSNSASCRLSRGLAIPVTCQKIGYVPFATATCLASRARNATNICARSSATSSVSARSR
jgi:hypothetical protein